jgi:hypothetical protein
MMAGDRTLRTLGWVLVVIHAGACAANPATNVATNGGAFRVRYATGTGTYVSNDVVGTDVHRDAAGNEIGSTDHVQAVEHNYQWSDWKYFQGRDELDEQDYYRLAGDLPASDTVAQIRAGAALKMKVGVPLIAVSIAALMLEVYAQGQGNNTLATFASYSSAATGIGGLGVWYWGKSEMKKPHHLPMSRADQNADVVEQCDEGRCRSQRGGRTGLTSQSGQ